MDMLFPLLATSDQRVSLKFQKRDPSFLGFNFFMFYFCLSYMWLVTHFCFLSLFWNFVFVCLCLCYYPHTSRHSIFLILFYRVLLGLKVQPQLLSCDLLCCLSLYGFVIATNVWSPTWKVAPFLCLANCLHNTRDLPAKVLFIVEEVSVTVSHWYEQWSCKESRPFVEVLV